MSNISWHLVVLQLNREKWSSYTAPRTEYCHYYTDIVVSYRPLQKSRIIFCISVFFVRGQTTLYASALRTDSFKNATTHTSLRRMMSKRLRTCAKFPDNVSFSLNEGCRMCRHSLTCVESFEAKDLGLRKWSQYGEVNVRSGVFLAGGFTATYSLLVSTDTGYTLLQVTPLRHYHLQKEKNTLRFSQHLRFIAFLLKPWISLCCLVFWGLSDWKCSWAEQAKQNW